MKLSARNVIEGTVKDVRHGVVNSEITIELPGGTQIVSIITKSSAESLQLEPGKAIAAIIKASHVMVGVD